MLFRSLRSRRSSAPRRRALCFEMPQALESRRLMAAHIVGDPTVYPSIQAAVTAAAPGSTIDVDAGTYSEMVTINKTLTLRGAQAGNDARTRSGSETIVNGQPMGGMQSASFLVQANDVVIDGFTVQGNTTNGALGAGIVIAPSQFGTHVVNDIVRFNVAGLYLSNAGPDQAL